MTVRRAVPADLPRIADIYDEQVATAISTFDLEPAPLSYWEARLGSAETGDHLLVVEVEGDVRGYAYSSAYRPRPAYRHTREVSVYLDSGSRSQGLGRQLYAALLDLLREDGVHTVLAVVALPNPGSEALHRAHGFERVGLLPQVGRKLDRWVDTALYALVL